MKEIIYLDTKLVNSLLAQGNAGLVTKLVNEDAETDTNSEVFGEQASTSAKVGLNAILQGGGAHTQSQTESYNIVFSKSNKNLIETALDDYSLDLLIDQLQKENSLKEDRYEDGDLLLTSGALTAIDFEQLAQLSNLNEIGSILPGYSEFQKKLQEYKKIQHKQNTRTTQLENEIATNSWNNFDMLKSMSEYTKKLLPNTNLVKINNTFSILPTQFMRVPNVQLSFMQHGKRQIKILGICSSTMTEQTPSDFSVLAESASLLKNAPTTILHVLLGSFGLIEKGDHLVRPIAIYFED